jgi:16S rRNA (cytidine1402-2'-O)-methyltransferase
MEVDRDAPHTLIHYESPYRLTGFFEDAVEVFGDRQAALCHELTKMYESVQRGTLSSLLESVTQKEPKGEHVIVIAGQERASRTSKKEREFCDDGEEDRDEG